MAIRIRIVNGHAVALCAAKSIEKEGDIYLDDGTHHALSTKFGLDFKEMGFLKDAKEDETLVHLMKQEENQNTSWQGEFHNKFKFTEINIDVEVSEDDNIIVLATTDKSEVILGSPIVVQADSFEEAKEKFWNTLKFINEYHLERSKELDLWKPFQKGNWKETGGKWFIIFGIHVSFRIGENMQRGRYIPFTKLNISIHNFWKRKIKKK
jgi:hypothetical protein